jgi:hypothetical protein
MKFILQLFQPDLLQINKRRFPQIILAIPVSGIRTDVTGLIFCHRPQGLAAVVNCSGNSFMMVLLLEILSQRIRQLYIVLLPERKFTTLK